MVTTEEDNLTTESRNRRARRKRRRVPVEPEQCGVRIDTGFPRSGRSRKRKKSKARPTNPVYLVDSPQRLIFLSRHLRSSQVLGVDIESAWKEGQNVTCLLQIADAERNWLVDPVQIGGLGPLKAVMEDPAIVKVIHDAIFEKRMLMAFGIKINNVFDTLVESRRTRGSGSEGGHSLKAVCLRELFIRMDKTEQRSDWSVRPLSPSQFIYAALDAEVLVKIHAILKDLPDAPPPPPPPEPEVQEGQDGQNGSAVNPHESAPSSGVHEGHSGAGVGGKDPLHAAKPRKRSRNGRRRRRKGKASPPATSDGIPSNLFE